MHRVSSLGVPYMVLLLLSLDWLPAVLCRDPNGTMMAFADMMKKQIVMPAHMMDDNIHLGRTGRNIFQDFSTVAESTGTYTAQVSCCSCTFHPHSHLHMSCILLLCCFGQCCASVTDYKSGKRWQHGNMLDSLCILECYASSGVLEATGITLDPPSFPALACVCS